MYQKYYNLIVLPKLYFWSNYVCNNLKLFLDIHYCTLFLVTATVDLEEAFTSIDYAILVGAMPRREGMERKDLLKANVKIFETQGKALNTWAKKTVKVKRVLVLYQLIFFCTIYYLYPF